MNHRHATKEYDKDRKISDADFDYIIEAGRLSPSSLGSEPWKFLVIQDPVLREKMMDVAPGAVEKLKTASHFVVILARKGVRYDSEYLLDHMKTVQHFPEDMLAMISEQYKHFQEGRNILDNSRTLDDWSAKQTYIALGNMLTAAAMIGIDSTPMEGFYADKLDALLEKEGLLEDSAYSASVLAAFGYRKEDPKRPKTRKSVEKLVKWI
ncbi:NAD(P)H-dependent oxidoreductase [Paracerasibacillus soli]|uniref:NAD(P)H-dependent oxidoreductase n=2 Tax=Paracerasibacillus soli TaxID=480284 RepID=A0ABU5CTQ8_9BACI|nr:NAD(P)H-dependent oxidoreductase [Virgibacillus soli]MDY0409758.1 NAD(P)H-dependent oxidoreductase [Virgibacillus soli]